VATLDPGTAELVEPSAGIDELGNVVAAWASAAPRIDSVIWATTRSVQDGRWARPARISAAGATRGPWLVVDGAGNATAVWVRTERETLTFVEHLESAYRPVGAAWKPPVELARSRSSGLYPSLVASTGGTVLLTWWQADDDYTGLGTIRASVSERGAWRPTVTLATGVNSSGGAAIGEGGVAAVGWSATEHGNSIDYAAVSHTGGASWGPAAMLSFEDGQAGPPQLAVDGPGDVTAVWRTNVDVETSRLPAGSDTWERPVALSDPTPYGGGPLIVGNVEGATAVLWDEYGAVRRVFARTRGAEMRGWEPAVEISGDIDTYGGTMEFEMDGVGDVIATWTGLRADRYPGPVFAATLDAAAPVLESLRAPRVGRIKKVLRLSAAFRDISTTAVRWQLGDGTSASGRAIGHAYRRPGSYLLTVTAADAARHTTVVTRRVRITR
jgi:hypothetical protein